MITFILGEDRHVKYFVHSIGQYDYFVIKDAKFRCCIMASKRQQAFVQSKKTKRKMVIMLM